MQVCKYCHNEYIRVKTHTRSCSVRKERIRLAKLRQSYRIRYAPIDWNVIRQTSKHSKSQLDTCAIAISEKFASRNGHKFSSALEAHFFIEELLDTFVQSYDYGQIIADTIDGQATKTIDAAQIMIRDRIIRCAENLMIPSIETKAFLQHKKDGCLYEF